MAADASTPPPSWVPPKSFYDCTQCPLYCPHYCFRLQLPPPPPPPPFDPTAADLPPSTSLSPLLIAFIAVLASAFLVFGYYAIVRRLCGGRRRGGDGEDPLTTETRQDAWPATATVSEGLDEAVIDSIAVCRYQKGDGFVESTDCPVCLAEFREGDQVRLLPRCCHAFHVHCIDSWLKSHPSCPVCRTNVPPVAVEVLLEMAVVEEVRRSERRGGNPLGFVVRPVEVKRTAPEVAADV